MKAVPFGAETEKQFGLAAAHVSVVVGGVAPTAGCTVTFIDAVVSTISASATWTAVSVFVALVSLSPKASSDSCIVLFTPQFGNGSENGQGVTLTKSVIVRVLPSPSTCTRWLSEKPAPIQDSPSSRVIVFGVPPAVVIGNSIRSAVLPPPWTTVRPPCGPGQKTMRVSGVEIVGSSAPRSSRSTLSFKPSIRRSRQAPSSPWIITSWPSMKPWVFQDSPAARSR